MTPDELLEDHARRNRADAWLERLASWAGYGAAHRRKALACEVVRGIVAVDEPEYAYAVDWASYGGRETGEPTTADWVTALELYGPVQSPERRADHADRLAGAALIRDRQSVQVLIR